MSTWAFPVLFIWNICRKNGALIKSIILGSANSLYGGLTFSEDATTIADNIDESSSGVRAYGMPFTLGVNTYDVANAEVMGFNLVWNQLPCGGDGHMRISNVAG